MNKDVVVLIPVYNPDEKIMDKFLDELTKKFKNIVFVNDGCSKKHKKYMDSLEEKYPVVKHNINLGKGRGLKNGINYILNNYSKCKVIVTADCDGQHSVKDIIHVANVAKEYDDSLILGVRDFSKSQVPFRSRFGNVLTRNVLCSFVGVRVSDTQTGLRGMSLDVARDLVDIPGERYEYETNVLIESKNRNILTKEVIIDTIYIDKNETSHFNPVKDSLRIYKLFTSYLLFSLIAYLVEVLVFAKTYNVHGALWVMPILLLFCKGLSSIIKIIFNNYVNIKYVLLNYIIVSGVILLISSHYVFAKIIIDIVMFILSLFLIKFKTRKYE